MAKRPSTSEPREVSSSEDEFQIDIYTDRFNKITIQAEENDSNDSDDDIIQPTSKRRNLINSDSDTSSEKENISIEDVSSEEWEDVSESTDSPSIIEFDIHHQTPGPQIRSNIKEPIDYFTLYFTNELIENIIKETNHYANEKIRNKQLSHNSTWHKWHDVTKQEFLAFIAVILNMGLIHLPNLNEYWSTDSISKIPFFSETFSRDRFLQIFWMLHLKKDTRSGNTIKTRIQKASNYIEYIDSKFREYFIPYKAISVSESMIKFKGRISFTTYNPTKPTKWGIRIYALADAKTGYLFSILPYFGSITSDSTSQPDLPVSTRIPLHLYKKLIDKVPDAQGYHMYTDRNYTSIPLAEELLKLKCNLTGTVKVNRKGIPMAIRKPKFSSKKTVAYRKNNITLLAWKDKRTVTMLSNYNNTEMRSTLRKLRGGNIISIDKPQMVLDYIANMGGVDLADQYASTYCFLRKSLKWWRTLFFWGLEMSVINSFILYRISEEGKQQKPMTHHKFVKSLVKQLRGDFRESRSRSSTSLSDNRLNNKLHILNLRERKRDCIVCSDRKTPGGRRQTSYYCETCTNQPAMHIGNCFKLYHTVENYKK